MKNAKRKSRKKLGFDDRELWSLDHTIAKFVLPRLIRFKEVGCGYPGNLTEKKWDKILDQMIYSMRAVCDEWENTAIGDTFFVNRINRGLCLFGKYFRCLWW
jgi:hypothetical protein